MSAQADVVIIVAGPAGMACAIEAAGKGVSVLVLDENPAPGGQIYRAVESAGVRRLEVLGPDYAKGKSLVSAFRAAKGIDYRPGSTVWNIGTDRRVEYSRDGRSYGVVAGSLVVATGALERPSPCPGWTLPGVTTAGALQILLKGSGVVHEDAVLVGAGPLLWLLAAQLVDGGTPPKAVVETTPPGQALKLLPQLLGALAAPRYLTKGLAMIRKVKRAGVPHHAGATNIRVEGETEVTGVSFDSNGTTHRIASTTVALHQGVVPNQQVTRLLRCKHVWDEAQRCFRPELDDNRETSAPRVFVAGDGAGIEGAVSAEMQGRLVGLLIAADAGHVEPERIAALRKQLRREASVRPFLEALYAPSPEVLAPADQTIICRCEEVTAGAVREAVDQGAPGPNQVKSFLRTGMGPCQGRVCGLAVASVIAERTGKAPQDVDYYRIRPPLKPLPLSELASYDSSTGQASGS